MFGFSSHQQKACGLIIDIGSGSVGAALVLSDATQPKPEILWSHREYVLIKDITTTEASLREITTSLVNMFLHIGSDAMKALRESDTHLSISEIQVTISAPWTYTVTKTVNFTDEHPFVVNDDFLTDLAKTAEKQAFSAVLENEIFKESQLEIIDNKTVGVVINGYPVEQPDNIKTREVSLAHITAITQKKIIDVLEDSKNKVLPKASLTTHSFMYMYYDVLKNMRPDTNEACLINITSEATEIGIIREGTLTQVTHTAFGTFSLAREIARTCKIPKDEAYTFMKGGVSFVETKLSAAKQEDLQIILGAYEEKIAELFTQTGDVLAIPKTLFLHTEESTEEFFIKHISKASKKATSMQHNIHPVTNLLFEDSGHSETSILLSAHNFHQEHIKSGDHE